MTSPGVPPDPLRLAAGAVAVAGTAALWPARRTLTLARRLPAVGVPLGAAANAVTARGDELIRWAVDAARTGLRILVREVVAAALDEVDITAIVRDHVDIDSVAEGIDVDRIAAQIDLDAIIARIDLVGLANQIIAAVDLPQIIRDSTGSLSEEAVRGVRSQGMQADDAVAGFVGRIFRRDRDDTDGPQQ